MKQLLVTLIAATLLIGCANAQTPSVETPSTSTYSPTTHSPATTPAPAFNAEAEAKDLFKFPGICKALRKIIRNIGVKATFKLTMDTIMNNGYNKQEAFDILDATTTSCINEYGYS